MIIRYLVIWALLLPGLAGAATLHIEWEFGGVAEYYRLYRNGVAYAKLFAPTELAADVYVPVVGLGDVFTMTAVYEMGETPQSAPFVVSPETIGATWLRLTGRITTGKPHGRLLGAQPAVLTPPPVSP